MANKREISRWGLGAVGVYLGCVATTLADPPVGRDAWRETDGLMVGRNFCDLGTPFWQPIVDIRGNGVGITGMEFPLLNYLHGMLGCVGLDQVLVARLLTLLATLGAAWAVYHLGIASARGVVGEGCEQGQRRQPLERQEWQQRQQVIACLALVVFLASPLTVYYGRAIQPDMVALAGGLIGLVLLGRGWVWASALSLMLGILIKLPAIVFGLPALVLWTQRLQRAGERRWLACAVCVFKTPLAWGYAAVILLPCWLWYSHARELQSAFGLQHFFLGKSASSMMWDVLNLQNIRLVLGQMFDVYVLPPLGVVAVVTMGVTWRRQTELLQALTVATAAYLLLAAGHVAYHHYYGVMVVPGLALWAAVGIATALERWKSGTVLRRSAAGALAVAVVAVGCGLHSWFRTQTWFVDDQAAAAAAKFGDTVQSQVMQEQPVALLSSGSPSLMWFMRRHGWLGHYEQGRLALTPADSPDALAPSFPVVLDLQRLDAPFVEQIQAHLQRQGYARSFANGRGALWLPSPAQATR